MLKIFKTVKAKTDLIRIWRYTFKKWGMEQADKYLMQLDQAINVLLHDPRIGIAYEHRKGYRVLFVNSHVVFYRLKENRVEVVRVLHKKMNPDKQMLS